MTVRVEAACSFSVGGLGVTVECDDAVLAAGLRQRYRQFSGPATVHFTAHIHLAGRQRASALLDTALIFSDGAAQFTAPGYQGVIDDQIGEGWLTLSSAQPVDDADYYLRVAFALLAFRQGGLMFHAAGIVRRGKGHVFFGYSGSGKTTVARLSSDATVLNDDLLLLKPAGDGPGWSVHATPFWNPSQVAPSSSSSAPLADLFRLVQDRRMYLEPMGRGQALAELVANVPVIPSDPVRLCELLERGRSLINTVPVYHLHFLPDASFWSVIDQAQTAE